MNADALILDTETTIFQKGNPFSDRNRLVAVGLLSGTHHSLFAIEYGERPYGEQLKKIQFIIDCCNLIVGFNLKFDLHWLRRYGIRFNHCRVWDCQLVEFILTNQTQVMPSLGETVSKYNLGTKLDVVERDYWSKGIDTCFVPWDVLETYLDGDISITGRLFELQQKQVSERKINALINLHNQDLLVLEEMEWNGTKFDWTWLKIQEVETEALLQKTEVEIKEAAGFGHFNPGSSEHVSALLYGGSITVDVPEAYQHTYKGGAKVGTTELRNRWTTVSHQFPKLVEPLKGTEGSKEGIWSVDDKVLRRIKGNNRVRQLLGLLQSRADYEKLSSTYYRGLPKLVEEYEWKDKIVHGQFNQCVAITGRLSSSKPNKQNFDKRMNRAIVSRFG